MRGHQGLTGGQHLGQQLTMKLMPNLMICPGSNRGGAGGFGFRAQVGRVGGNHSSPHERHMAPQNSMNATGGHMVRSPKQT